MHTQSEECVLAEQCSLALQVNMPKHPKPPERTHAEKSSIVNDDIPTKYWIMWQTPTPSLPHPQVSLLWHIEYFIIVNSHCSQFKFTPKRVHYQYFQYFKNIEYLATFSHVFFTFRMLLVVCLDQSMLVKKTCHLIWTIYVMVSGA